MKMFLTLCFCLLVFSDIFCQATGYLGSRFFLSVKGSLTPQINEHNYGYDEICPHTISFLTPFGFEANYVVSNGLTIGVGYTRSVVKGHFYNVRVDTALYHGYGNYYSSGVKYNASYFNLYFEGHRRHAYSVIDNYYRFGVSYTAYKNVSYYSSLTGVDFDNTNTACDISDGPVVFRLNQKSSISPGTFVEFGNRIPLSEHILVYYGISSYFFPFRRSHYHDKNSSANLIIDPDNTFIIDVGKFRVGNGLLCNINFGLTWAL